LLAAAALALASMLPFALLAPETGPRAAPLKEPLPRAG
jgi:hypothetical protein